MTQTSCSMQSTHPLTGQHSVSFALKRLYRQFKARMKERRKRRRLLILLRCDDAILKDIGHTRAELEMALNLPYSVSADDELKQWRQWRVTTG